MKNTQEPYIKTSYVSMSLKGFIELLQAHWHPKRVGSSYKKTGPFSWEEPYGKNTVRSLYLGRISRLSADRRVCKIFEHICWHPLYRIVLPWRSRHVMTLLITRIESNLLHVHLVCRDLRGKDTMFKHFAAELDKLATQYAKPGMGTAHAPQQLENGKLKQDRGPAQETEGGEAEPETPSPTAEPWTQVPDVGWDRQALKLWWAGYTVPQIAARLHLNEKTVRNRLSTLRQIYPEEIVPTANQLRKMGLR